MNRAFTTFAGVLPDPKGKPSPGDRQLVGLHREVMRRDPPGYPTNNQHLLSNQYVGTQYTAIKAMWSWLGGSTVVVEQEREAVEKSRRTVRKATQPGGLGNDDRYHPVDSSDELAALFEHINDVDTFQDFIAQLVIQITLTGNAHIWLPRNADGKPSEMWVLPSVMLQPLPGGFTPEYPFGGWRLGGNYGWGMMGIPAMGNVPLDRREVVHYREPHAYLRSNGYGPTEAMRRQIDVLNAVETARASSLAKAVNVSGIVTVDGISQDGADELAKRINSGYGGADNAGKVWVADGTATKFTPTTASPKDLDMPAGWEQSGRAVLSGYRVPPVVAGIIEANYAEFWGAVRAWFAGDLQPFATRFSAVLTKHVARKCYGPGYRVRLQLPPINDPELSIQQRSYTPNDLRTVNEHRAADDLPPMKDGDVVPSVYAAKQNQAMGLGADGQPVQQPGDPNAAGGQPDMSGHPLSAVGDSILEALGVQGGDGASHPGNDPFGGDDSDVDDDSPDDTDVMPFGRKAFGSYDEGKHKRDHGKFARTQGAAGAQAKEYQRLRGAGHDHASALQGASEIGGPAPRRRQDSPLRSKPELPANLRTPTRATPLVTGTPVLPPAVARHPKVLAALKHLTDNAANIATAVNAGMLAHGLTPEAIIGDQQSWAMYFATAHADVLAQTLHIDTQTAFAVLSHLAAQGVSAIRRHLKGKADASPAPGLARRPDSGDNAGSIPRPDIPGAEGSLPSRLKAFLPVPELDALLAELV